MATHKNNVRTGVALGTLAAAAAGAAAGYYFYGSSNAKKHRKLAAKWANDMKKDVVAKAKKLQDVDKAQLVAVIDDAAAAYRSVKNIDRRELARAATELKNNWRLVAEELAGATRARAKRTRKTVKKRKRRAGK